MNVDSHLKYPSIVHDFSKLSDNTRGCRAHINCGEICDRVIKVLIKKIYCSIALIKLLQVLLLKFCLTLDQFDSKKCSSLTVDFRKYFELTFSLTAVADLPTVYVLAIHGPVHSIKIMNYNYYP